MNDFFAQTIRSYIYIDYIHVMYLESEPINFVKSSNCYYRVLAANDLFTDASDGIEIVFNQMYIEYDP